MSVEVLETQTSRENKLIALVAAVFPNLELTSRREEERDELSDLPSAARRLSFGKRKPFWARPFDDARRTRPAITITSQAQRSLDLHAGWTDMSIHVFKADLLQKATHLATSISAATGKSVNVIQEE